ncbi:MAG: nickel pincer cofactor biosynthesis protein LarC [Anaerolineae bacterium]
MGRTIAYFDCFSGASGDMLLGALLDAGLERAALEAGLAKIGIAPSSLVIDRQTQHGITGTSLTVLDDHTDHPVRNLPVVRTLIEASDLPKEIIAPSLAIFTRIAEVEGAVHGLGTEEVHFHELSAIDSLVDIVGFNIALVELGIEAVFSSPLPLGHGSVKTSHGLLPLPAPATLALLAKAQAPTIPSPASFELVTPTGAAILTSLAEFRQPSMAIHHVGYGLGHKALPWANIVRVWIGHELDLPAAAHGAGAHHHHHGDHSH